MRRRSMSKVLFACGHPHGQPRLLDQPPLPRTVILLIIRWTLAGHFVCLYRSVLDVFGKIIADIERFRDSNSCVRPKFAPHFCARA